MDYLDKPLQRLLGGFIRLHVLYHAEEGGIYGNWMIEELRHHGYKISPGTLYPMLRAMEKDGWIVGSDENGGNRRRLYKITSSGRKALKEARAKLRELFSEVADPTKKRGQA
ncbi:MAG: PadR family transcriptional regulator [Terrimicrobiaceae bacterium]